MHEFSPGSGRGRGKVIVDGGGSFKVTHHLHVVAQHAANLNEVKG